MALDLSEDQRAIRDAARAYLRDNADFARVRSAIESAAGWDEALWRSFAADLGFAGLGIAEADGGIGFGPIEQALILEELGSTLAPIPWFESVVLAATPIAALAVGDQRSRLLGGIASGSSIATLAMRTAGGGSLPDGIGPRIRQDGDRALLEGEAHHVPFGHIASLLLVAARSEGHSGWDGLTLLVLPADTPGLSVERVTSLDLTRPLAIARFDAIPLGAEEILGQVGKAGPVLRRSLAMASGLLAAEMLGGASRSLAETVAYAQIRVQFGRTIGSFQAVKHRLADMKLLVDYARTATDWAARAIASEGDVEEAAAGALSYCSDAYLGCAADAIQLHGGIGFTWDHHAHLFFKRARAASALLDSPADHREVIARALLDTGDNKPETA